MKRILFICPFSPANHSAGESYTNQLILELSNDLLVDLVYFRYSTDKPYGAPNSRIRVIREELINKKDKIKAFVLHPGTFPLFNARLKKNVCAFLQQQIERENYDFVYFDFSQSFGYAKYIEHSNKILMAHDVISQKYERMKTYLRPWVIKTEREMLKYGKVVLTFSEKDCELMKKLYGIEAISTTFFLNPDVIEAVPEQESDYFVFFGHWGRIENSEALDWFLDNVYPQLTADMHFKIVGGGKMPEAVMAKITSLPNVDYLGFVDNPYPIIANAKAEIAPLRKGAGVKVKCIESLGCGTPVIGTDVAFEGIPSEFTDFLIRAHSADDYVNAISKTAISITEKQRFKRTFIEQYNHKAVLSYIVGNQKQF